MSPAGPIAAATDLVAPASASRPKRRSSEPGRPLRLREARQVAERVADPALVGEAGAALAARTASEPDEPDTEHWKAMSAEAAQVLDAEERLWAALA